MEEKQKSHYLPGIDGLRAIAVLGVIFYHMDLLPFLKGGFTGVDIFFVISGYVISKSLYSRTPSFSSLADFYRRRVLRIMPALFLCLLITLVVSVLFIPPSWMNDTMYKTGLAAFAGISNIAQVRYHNGYFSPRMDFNPFLHTWSLGIEEQFYLLFPLIYFVWLKYRNRKSFSGILSRGLLGGLVLLSLGIGIYETYAHSNRAFYLLPSRFWELAAGGLLFQFHSQGRLMVKSSRGALGMTFGGFLLIGTGFLFARQWAFPFPWALIPVSGALCLLSAIAVDNPLAKVLKSPAMVYLGKISYSLYLWHWPVAVFLRWTVGFHTYGLMLFYLAFVFFLGASSYRYVEKPLRTNIFLIKQGSLKILTGGLVLFVIVFSASLFLVRSNREISLSVTRDNYIWRPGEYKQDECPATGDVPGTGKKIFVFGDSHTAAYRTMLHIISCQLGVEVFEYEEGGCAVAGLLEPMSNLAFCISYYQRSLEEIKALAQPGDILFLASLRMPELSNRFEKVDIASVVAEFYSSEAEEKRERAVEEASRLIEEFEALGVIVLIDAPKPVLKAPPYRCSDWFNCMNPICAPGFSVSLDFLLELRQPVMDSLTALKQRHPDLYIWDPFVFLCEGQQASAYDQDGLPLFYDDNHLSAHGNRVLAPAFKEKILAIWESTG